MKNRDLGLGFCRIAISFFLICYHFSCHTTYVYKPFSNLINGALINFVFFILSGFSLFGKYNNDFCIKKFYIARCKRIYPLFYLMQIIFFLRVLIITPILLDGIPYYSYFLSVLGLDGYLSARVGSVGFAGDWYIGLQIIIYLIYPVLCKANKKFPFFTLCFLTILYIIWFRFNLFNVSIIYMPIIFGALGVYIGMMLSRYRDYIFDKPIVFVLALIFVAISYDLAPKYGYFLNILFYTSLFISFYFIGKMLCKNEYTGMLFSFLSKYSYGTLLCHHQIILIILQYFQIINISSSWLCILSIISLSFLMSFVATNLVNRISKKIIK